MVLRSTFRSLAQTLPFIKPINCSCFSVLNASFKPNYQLNFRPVSRHHSFFCKLQTEDKGLHGTGGERMLVWKTGNMALISGDSVAGLRRSCVGVCHPLSSHSSQTLNKEIVCFLQSAPPLQRWKYTSNHYLVSTTT